MTYTSLIDDIEIVQGDSSSIWFLGHPDNRLLDGGDWSAQYIIAESFGGVELLRRTLPVNSGTGEGDKYIAGTKFIFQILPSESAQMLYTTKYYITVEITNTSIQYNGEVARFKAKVLQGSN